MTIKSHTHARASAGEGAMRPEKPKGFRVTLYGQHSRPLFQWNGKAETAAKAELLSFEIYKLSVQALCKTQGVIASLSALDLEVSASNVQTSSAPEGWRNLPAFLMASRSAMKFPAERRSTGEPARSAAPGVAMEEGTAT